MKEIFCLERGEKGTEGAEKKTAGTSGQISYKGLCYLSPPDEVDSEMKSAINAHQRHASASSLVEPMRFKKDLKTDFLDASAEISAELLSVAEA